MHAPGDAAPQPGTRREPANRREREGSQRGVGDDSLPRHAIAAVARQARALAAVGMRDVAAQLPAARGTAAHGGIAGQRPTEWQLDASAAKGGDAQWAHADRQIVGAQSTTPPDAAARRHVTRPGQWVGEPHVGIELQRARHPAHRDMAVERAGASDDERRRDLVNQRCGELRHRDVGSAHEQLASRAGRLYLRQRRAADERGITVAHVGVGDGELRRVTVHAHGVSQPSAPCTWQPGAEPAQVGERQRRSGEIEPEAGPAEADGAVAAHLRSGQRHPRATPPQRIAARVQHAGETSHVDRRRTVRFGEHPERADVDRGRLPIVCKPDHGKYGVQVAIFEYALVAIRHALRALAGRAGERRGNGRLARQRSQRGVRSPRATIHKTTVMDRHVRELGRGTRCRTALRSVARPHQLLEVPPRAGLLVEHHQWGVERDGTDHDLTADRREKRVAHIHPLRREHRMACAVHERDVGERGVRQQSSAQRADHQLPAQPLVALRHDQLANALVAPRRVRQHHHNQRAEQDGPDDEREQGAHDARSRVPGARCVRHQRRATRRERIGHRHQNACPIAKCTTSRRPMERSVPGEGSSSE